MGNLKSAKNLEKMILDKISENDLLENCPRILDEFSEYFRFFNIINYFSAELLMPYVLSPQFLCKLASSVRTGQSISTYGPRPAG